MATAASIWAKLLTSNVSTTDQASVDTASTTPTSGKIVIAWVSSRMSGTPNTPTIAATGLGSALTWTQITTVTVGSGITLTAFWALADGSSGIVRFDFGGQTQLAQSWQIAEFANVNTTTPIVQTSTATATASTACTVTLSSALAAAHNRTCSIHSYGQNGNLSATADMQLINNSNSAYLNNTDATAPQNSEWLFGTQLVMACTSNTSAGNKVALGFELSQDGTGIGGSSTAQNRGILTGGGL